MTKVTVLLPVYNGALYLRDSIESVLNQSYKDFELIIIDDCSTDNTAAIAQGYAKKFKNVLYSRNEKNLKLPKALNKGFTMASGEYWTWTSCDNIYYPNALETLVAVLEGDSKCGLVYASMELINEKGDIIGHLKAGPSEKLIFQNVVGACFLYRKDIAKRVGEYNPHMFLCEDYEYWVRLSLVTRLKPVQECLYRYRRHPQSLSATREKEIIEKGIKVQKFYFEKTNPTRAQTALFYAYLRGRDIYNPFRHFYLLVVLYYSPILFLKEIFGLISRRFKNGESN